MPTAKVIALVMKSSATATHVCDFYQQLALLVRANLPLPDSLRQLGRDFPQPKFQRVLTDIGKQAASGHSLAEAMRRFPDYFSAFHIQLVAAGEATGTLPQVLFTIARSARFSQLFVARIRDVIAYPLLTIHLALLLGLGLSIFVVPVFAEMFADLYEGARLPAMTEAVLGMAAFIQTFRYVFLVLYILLFIFSVWVVSPGLAAHRALLRVTRILPGACQLLRSLDAGRLCSLWSTFLARRMTLPDMLASSVELVESGALAEALERMSRRAAEGTGAGELMAREKQIDPLIVLTFRHTPEEELPAELERLATLFEHRVSLAARSAAITWSAIAIIAMAFFVGFTVIAMFAPLIQITSCLGG